MRDPRAHVGVLGMPFAAGLALVAVVFLLGAWSMATSGGGGNPLPQFGIGLCSGATALAIGALSVVAIVQGLWGGEASDARIARHQARGLGSPGETGLLLVALLNAAGTLAFMVWAFGQPHGGGQDPWGLSPALKAVWGFLVSPTTYLTILFGSLWLWLRACRWWHARQEPDETG